MPWLQSIEIRVAQRKRGGPITHSRLLDANLIQESKMHRNPGAVLRAAASLLPLPRAAVTSSGAAAAARRQTLPKAKPSHEAAAWLPLPAAAAPSASVGRSRAFSSAVDYGKDVDEVNRKFAEAREEIEAAMESKETVYFDEEASIARDAANDALGAFDALLARIPPADADALRRSMGLKMEQLKAELKQLED
ncbi:hypothetical protein U9M48_042387 [Paspalum notatum var. saurae]|uniref:Late embryogenesis abundant protein n=1 Tax=Paspalum notatum var. saurae TaxID=547442 RepID=A0AAQ3UR08_PASNO